MKKLELSIISLLLVIHTTLPAFAETLPNVETNTGAESPADATLLPNLSMIQQATFLELMQVLAKPGNKIYWLCGQDIIKKTQHPNRVHALSPECRSELNRVLLKDVNGDSAEVTALALEITKGQVLNRDKLVAIYSWVTENISFDVTTYTEIVKNKKILQNPVQLISPLQTLKTRTALAEGYSLLTAALLRAVNIPAVTIVGLAVKENKIQGPHAWNEAYIEDHWVNLDTTWDAGVITGNFEEGLVFNRRPTKLNLDLKDSEFKKTHKAVIDIR